MKKQMRKVAVILVAVLMVGAFAGCGKGFDASAYLDALLDNSYKNDSTDFVAQKIGTAEEAAALYEEGIDAEVDATLATVDVSDEMEQEYREAFEILLSKAKYTVGEAEKQKDGSYIVTVTYQQAKIFGPATEAYMAYVEELTVAWSQAESEDELPTEEEMYDMVYGALAEELVVAAENVEYGEEETTTVTIELNDNVYEPNESDIVELESLLFDTDAVF